MRVLVWNAQGFRRGVDAAVDVAAAVDPDVIVMTECGSRRRLRRFEDELDMASAVARPFRRGTRNAILARPPYRIADPRLHGFASGGGSHPRGALIVAVRKPGISFTAVSVHLGLAPGERRRHARELTDALRSFDGPLLVGGDMNEGPDGDAVSWISERFWDAWDSVRGPGFTFPSGDPIARIDYLFVSEGIRVIRSLVGDTDGARAASDHLPLVVELQIPEPTTGGRDS